MKIRNYFVLILMSLVCNVSGVDVIEYLKTRGMFEVVSATPTNLTLELKDLMFVGQPYAIPPLDKRVSEYIANNEHLILPTDRVTVISGAFGPSISFAPVLFKDKREGLRIVEQLVRGSITNTVMYIALGDTLTAMEEVDVEMVMEMDEWKTFEEAVSIRAFIPREESGNAIREDMRRHAVWRAKKAAISIPEEPQPVPISEPPIAETEEDALPEETPPVIEAISPVAPPPNQSELPPTTATETKPSTTLLVLLCGLATLGLCTTIYFAWKKKQK